MQRVLAGMNVRSVDYLLSDDLAGCVDGDDLDEGNDLMDDDSGVAGGCRAMGGHGWPTVPLIASSPTVFAQWRVVSTEGGGPALRAVNLTR